MRFEEWEPVYEAILSEFGFSRAADERCRDLLADLVGPFDEEQLGGMRGSVVAVAGGAGTLTGELALVEAAEFVVAAGAAAGVLSERGVGVDCVVTDLDSDPGVVVALAAAGVPVVVHAHGDNQEVVRTWVPRLPRQRVLGTTQAAPVGPVRNYGGFTDGDRAAFLADAFGASSLVFPGWEFDDPGVGGVKRQKLVWAERLVWWLERRRGERFGVLDGRRSGIETGWLPE